MTNQTRVSCADLVRTHVGGVRCANPARFDVYSIASSGNLPAGERVGSFCGAHVRHYRHAALRARVRGVLLPVAIRLLDRDLYALAREAVRTWEGFLDFAQEAYEYSPSTVAELLVFESVASMILTLSGGESIRSEDGPRRAFHLLAELERERLRERIAQTRSEEAASE